MSSENVSNVMAQIPRESSRSSTDVIYYAPNTSPYNIRNFEEKFRMSTYYYYYHLGNEVARHEVHANLFPFQLVPTLL
jgi:hypothetical protein